MGVEPLFQTSLARPQGPACSCHGCRIARPRPSSSSRRRTSRGWRWWPAAPSGVIREDSPGRRQDYRTTPSRANSDCNRPVPMPSRSAARTRSSAKRIPTPEPSSPRWRQPATIALHAATPPRPVRSRRRHAQRRHPEAPPLADADVERNPDEELTDCQQKVLALMRREHPSQTPRFPAQSAHQLRRYSPPTKNSPP